LWRSRLAALQRAVDAVSQAALRIQSVFRGHLARKELERLRREAAAAADIQEAWGRHKHRQRTLALILEVPLLN
jgi:hypothetical protein